jgi:hypothetical protein
MKKRYIASLFFFFQICLLAYIKRLPSLESKKNIFVISEILLCFLLGYLCFRQASKNSITAKSASQTLSRASVDSASQISALEQEKQNLHSTLLETTAIYENAQKELEQKREQTEELEKKVIHLEQAVKETFINKKTCLDSVQRITQEVQNLCLHIEQERRTHAIEVRALLGKDDKKSLKAEKATTPYSIAPTLSPFANALLTIYQCQKEIESNENKSWPSQEHYDLVRRAYFDRLKSIQSPLLSFSLSSSTESFCSPKFPNTVKQQDIVKIIEQYGSQLQALAPFEPFHLHHESLKVPSIAFKLSCKNLEDLVIVIPA